MGNRDVLNRWAFKAGLDVVGSSVFDGPVKLQETSTPHLTANQNNWDPAELGFGAIIPITSDASRDITGVAAPGGTEPNIYALANAGVNNIVLKHNSTSSTTTNRFLLPGDEDLTLTPNSAVWIWYDSGQSRWFAISRFTVPTHNHDAAYVNEGDHTKAAHDSLDIDADTLDGMDSAAFATSGHGHASVAFSVGTTILNPQGGETIMVWRAPFACTVTNVRVHFKGGTSVVYNARRNQANNHLASNQTHSTANAWGDGGAVQNTAYVAGDDLELLFVTITGAVTEATIQVDFTRTI